MALFMYKTAVRNPDRSNAEGLYQCFVRAMAYAGVDWENLRLCIGDAELPSEGGDRPIRACGTRFVCHKVAAISRIIDRYGAYITHVTALLHDASVKAADKAKLKGYVKKWSDAKMLVGCAVFQDILAPAAILCKSLQDDELCIVSAIEAILKASKAVKWTP